MKRMTQSQKFKRAVFRTRSRIQHPCHYKISFPADDCRKFKTTYARINADKEICHEEIENQSICINADIKAVINKIILI